MTIVERLADGGRLVSISRICDLIKLDFLTEENEVICLHIQASLMLGKKDEKLLISSNDIYLPSKNQKKSFFKRFKWDTPGNSMFDDQLHDFREKIINKNVDSVQSSGKDLILYFDDNYKIEILACTLERERELYRIFKKGDFESHIVVET